MEHRRVFISYSHDNTATAKEIQFLLKAAYDHVWFDKYLPAGVHWPSEIQRQIATCDHFIFLVSKDSVYSRHCMQELVYARKQGKHVIPIIIEQDVKLPRFLSDIQYIDMAKGINARGTSELFGALLRYSDQDGYTVNTSETPVMPELDIDHLENISRWLEKRQKNLSHTRSVIQKHTQRDRDMENIDLDAELAIVLRSFNEIIQDFDELTLMFNNLRGLDDEPWLVFPKMSLKMQELLSQQSDEAQRRFYDLLQEVIFNMEDLFQQRNQIIGLIYENALPAPTN